MDPLRDSRKGSATLSLDEIFDVLANERRRRLLVHLIEHPDAQYDLNDVIELLASAGRPADAMRLDVAHLHLPKLEAAGVIEFDERSEVIEYRGDDLLEEYLHRVVEHEDAG